MGKLWQLENSTCLFRRSEQWAPRPPVFCLGRLWVNNNLSVFSFGKQFYSVRRKDNGSKALWLVQWSDCARHFICFGHVTLKTITWKPLYRDWITTVNLQHNLNYGLGVAKGGTNKWLNSETGGGGETRSGTEKRCSHNLQSGHPAWWSADNCSIFPAVTE